MYSSDSKILTVATTVQRNTRAPAGLQAIEGLILDEVAKTTAVRCRRNRTCLHSSCTCTCTPLTPCAIHSLSSTALSKHSVAQSLERVAAAGATTDGGATNSSASWRSKPAGAAGGSSAAAAASAASGQTAASAAAAALPDVKIRRAEDIGRKKWAPVKDLTSAAQGKQKLRGILNKLTPDNFDKLVSQARPTPAAVATPSQRSLVCPCHLTAASCAYQVRCQRRCTGCGCTVQTAVMNNPSERRKTRSLRKVTARAGARHHERVGRDAARVHPAHL
jgi:hypothetical protein